MQLAGSSSAASMRSGVPCRACYAQSSLQATAGRTIPVSLMPWAGHSRRTRPPHEECCSLQVLIFALVWSQPHSVPRTGSKQSSPPSAG